jgi:hypothetical protein
VNNVKKILDGFNINYPIIFRFKKPREFSEYGIAAIDATTYSNYNFFINYNPHFIMLEFDELVKSGLHEYCHIIYRQKEDFSNKELQQIFLNIDYDHFIGSIDYLTKKFVLECLPQIHPDNREILNDPRVIEEFFVEGFAEYFMGSQAKFFIEEKNHFEIIVNTHIQIMKGIRRLHFGEV